MESSQYFIAKSDKYVLVRKIGNRDYFRYKHYACRINISKNMF